jgi:hypothetical protein
MLETEGYLRQAAGSFEIAGAYLEDAEEELRKCVRMLEECAKMMRGVPDDELLFWGQVDDILQADETAEEREVEAVNTK